MAKQKRKQKPKPIETLGDLAKALAAAGVKRSIGRLSRIAQHLAWREAGLPRKGPWQQEQVPLMAKVIRGLQEDRNAPATDGGEEKEGTEPSGNHGWDIDKLVRSDDLARAKSVAQIKVAIEKTSNLIVDRKIKEREYVARDVAEESGAAKWRAVKAALMQIPKALRQLLADTTDPGKVEDILNTVLRRVCDEGFEGGK